MIKKCAMSTEAKKVTYPLSPPRSGEAGIMAKFFRVLGDPTRLKVLYLLREHEHTVSEMAEILGVLQPRLSSHLACLRWCGLVGQRKEGKLTYYYLSDEHILNILDMADAFLQDNATNIGLCTIVDRSS